MKSILIKYSIVLLLTATQACAQSDTSGMITNRIDFKSVLETNSYYDIVEKLIEARYTDRRTAIIEKMEAPGDSVKTIEERIKDLERRILSENALFIQWERDHRDGKNFAAERNKKEMEIRSRILLITPKLEALKWRKVFYQRELGKHASTLTDLNQQQEKELSQAKTDRRTALVKMYRA